MDGEPLRMLKFKSKASLQFILLSNGDIRVKEMANQMDLYIKALEAEVETLKFDCVAEKAKYIIETTLRKI